MPASRGQLGKQIRIYLADGSPAGIRHAEIANWSGQALACPRARFQELREWQEVKRPGVYFLVGQDDETGEAAVYIGEAEVVIERLTSHFNEKDFWRELIAFTSKDDNLTKAHIRYLESRLITYAKASGRYSVKNSKQPQIPVLPRGERDAMEDYIESVKTLLGILGHRLLDPLLEIRKPTFGSQSKSFSPETFNDGSVNETPSSVLDERVFYIKVKNLTGSALLTDEGLVVLKGSNATSDEKENWPKAQRALRDRLVTQGVLFPEDGKLRFAKDHLFNSPSQAAGIIVGGSINGRTAWKLADGRTTYADYEKMVSERLLRELESDPSNVVVKRSSVVEH